ncbi:hypothetical protein BGZ51_002204 [Haplosporangium sp. Z 767]|nr:hypothetical protein BGZ51_002204 [Haplosporangium sp. Z 767]KAF9187193.1 hypothetical protein BGZ50_002050 [Haplosporangium sp. Z 11]
MQAASKTLTSENDGSDKSQIKEAARLIGPDVTRIEQSLQPTKDNIDVARNTINTGKGNRIDSIVAGPNSPSPWSTYYNQTYADGSWGAGIFVQDHIRIDYPAQAAASSGPSATHGATVTFLNVVQDNLGLVRGYNGQISGLLGLTRASPTGRKTFLQELVDQGSLSQPVISMHLEFDGGSFLLGGIDHSQYFGELVYNPVTDPVAWQISLQGLGTQSRTAANQSKMMPQLSIFQDATLILDSGTSSILIPNAASEAIHGELSGTWDPIYRIWFLPCDGPDLIWWISSDHGVVQPYESLVHALGDGRCQSLIFNNQNADYWILGDTWLRGLYVVYDMEDGGRVGIASAISPSAQNGSVTVGPRARILGPQGVNAGVRLQNHAVNVVIASGLLLLIHTIIEILL